MHLFVPGRICLVGEHSDWAGGHRRSNPRLEKGFTLISGTDQGLAAKVLRHPNSLLLSASAADGSRRGPVEIPLQSEILLAHARQGGFWSYIAGVAYQVVQRYRVDGLVIDNHHTDLPVQKGLSSSAAICVLTVRAFNQLYGLGLDLGEEMELAYLGETTTPSRCGRMDQGCAFGKRPVLMTFDGDMLETRPLEVASPLHFVIVDLQAHKDTRLILDSLNRCYPVAADDLARGVQEALGPLNKRLVLQAAQALEQGRAEQLGALLAEAQQTFDRLVSPACPQELAAPVLHRVLEHPGLQTHIWGGKGVGSQGDGSAQFVCRSAEDQRAVLAVLDQELGLRGLPLTLDRQGDNRV